MRFRRQCEIQESHAGKWAAAEVQGKYQKRKVGLGRTWGSSYTAAKQRNMEREELKPCRRFTPLKPCQD